MTDPSQVLAWSLVLEDLLQLLSCVSHVHIFFSSFLSSHLFFLHSSFLFILLSFGQQLFLNYLLYHVNISFCRQVPFVNVIGFLVCRYYGHISFGQCIHVSPIFHLPLHLTQNMFCWPETLTVKPGMVGHTSTQAFVGRGREIEIQGQHGINSELQLSVWLK
jgi:hypothetical protein